MGTGNKTGISKWRKLGLVLKNAFSSGLNRDLVGEEFQGQPFSISQAETLAYAMAVSDPNEAYFQKEGAIAPPLFSSRILMGAAEPIILHPNLGMNVLKMVHAEQSFKFIRPLPVGTTVTPWAKIAEVKDVSAGEILVVDLAVFLGEEKLGEGVLSMLVRGKKKKGKKAAKPEAGEGPRLKPVATLKVEPDQPRKYAAASHDFNPLHTNRTVARLAGFKAPIAHGLCVVAMTAAQIVKLYADADPAKLKTLSVRFSKPVYPGQELTLKAATVDKVLHFVVENAKGKPVLSNGRATIAN